MLYEIFAQKIQKIGDLKPALCLDPTDLCTQISPREREPRSRRVRGS